MSIQSLLMNVVANRRRSVDPIPTIMMLIKIWVVLISSLYMIQNVVPSMDNLHTEATTVVPELLCGYEYLYRYNYMKRTGNRTTIRTNSSSDIPKPSRWDKQNFINKYIDTLRFPNIVKNWNESIVQIDDRMIHVLIYFANQPLPNPNVTEDDYESIRPSNPTDDELELVTYMTTNPQFNSRNDVRTFVSRTISRILLQCNIQSIYNDLDLILLHPDTKPFSLTGTSERGTNNNNNNNQQQKQSSTTSRSIFGDIDFICHRDGDYDFALMDLIALAYTIRQQQQSIHYMNQTLISPEAQRVLELQLLSTTTGSIQDAGGSYELPCRIKNAPIFKKPIPIYLQVDDTENHVLMTQVARYLTNQLYTTYYPDMFYDKRYNNDKNGNIVWMANHLASFMGQEQFYEYNSKPYQGTTVVAINLLHTFAKETSIKIAAQNVLDMITVWNTVQSDHLRRVVPFRRQPGYVSAPQSWAGDNEFQRLSVLVGNNNAFPEKGETELITTAISAYRVDPIILDLFFPSNNNMDDLKQNTSSRSTIDISIPAKPHYFVGRTGVTEIYASTEKVLISAGGNPAVGDLGKRRITPINRPIRNSLRIAYLFNTYIVKDLLNIFTKDEQGWSRPTTIIPRSNYNDYDIRSMIRFQGHVNVEDGATTQNLCVAPNFACGLQLEYGTRIGNDDIMSNCSVTIGDWTFLNLYHDENDDDHDDHDHDDNDASKSTKTICPNDGYYIAIYNRLCDFIRCAAKAETFGLLEIMEPNTIYNHTNNIDFITFQQQVMNNNPNTFYSEGIMTYHTISGNTIQFEIHPIDGTSSIVQYDTTIYERDYTYWPIARSTTIQSTTPGRITIDNKKYNNQRLILDVTIPTQPRRLYGNIPTNIRHSETYTGATMNNTKGFIFDDASSIVQNDTITSITCYTNVLHKLIGYRMIWSNGLSVVHGSTGIYTKTHTFQKDESIIILAVGTAMSYTSILSLLLQQDKVEHVSYIQIQLNNGILFDCGRKNGILSYHRDLEYYSAKPGEEIIAFYGRTTNNIDSKGDHRIDQLGAIYTTTTTTSTSRTNNKLT